eukprot:c7335_g1_i1.p1 GENE.c7335_g1_i1~~c7335_g1_i1.p1  ORF type:complete len:235 (+),score=46.01 c7335_g1_i1:1-705(+)
MGGAHHYYSQHIPAAAGGPFAPDHGGYPNYFGYGYGYEPSPHMMGAGVSHQPPYVPGGLAGPGSGSIELRRIFVAHLPFETSLVEFREYFERFGTVEDAYIPKDHGTGKSRGFGFLTFHSAQSVQRVVEHGVHMIGGRRVTIDAADPKGSGHESLGSAPKAPPPQSSDHSLGMSDPTFGYGAFDYLQMSALPGPPPASVRGGEASASYPFPPAVGAYHPLRPALHPAGRHFAPY